MARVKKAPEEVGLPTIAGGPEAQRSYPRLPSYPSFVLCFHPDRWVARGGAVVPDLAKIKVQAGINGATRTRGGAVNLAGARQNRVEAGFQEIPMDLDGEPYCKGYLLGNGGRCYLERWQRPIPGSKRIRVDVEDMAAFHAAVRANYGGPAIEILEGLEAQLLDQIDHLEDKKIRKPSVSRLLEKARTDLAAVKAEIEATDTTAAELEAAPLPDAVKPKRVRKPKA